MKLRKTLVSALIVGMGVLSSGQIFAADQMSTMKMQYEVRSSETLATVEAEYKALFLKYLKDYANIDEKQIPANAKWEVTIKDRASIIAEYERLAQAQKNDENFKSMYEETLKSLEQAKKDTYDEIVCRITLPTSKDKHTTPYKARFNGDTKALLFLNVPESEEATDMLVNDKPAKISADDYKAKYSVLVVRDKLAGIEEAKDVTKENADPKLPIMIFEDTKDSSKKVTIYLDGSNGNLSYIYVW